MQQLIANQFEKIGFQDFNDAQAVQAQFLQDFFTYNFLGRPSSGVLGASLKVSYTSSLVASIAAGAGFFYDSGQTGYNPKFRMIQSASAITVNLTANSNGNNRIDLICLAPNYSTTSTASRYVKTGGVGPVALTTVDKFKQDGYTLQVVAGTPGVSPVAPSTPAGYIALAQVLNRASSAGMSGSGAITDVRTVLGMTASNTAHNYATGTSVQTQLDELDAAITPTVSTVTTNQTLSATNTIIRSNSTSGSLTHTLPAVAAAPVGAKIVIKDVGSGAHTTSVKGSGSELVDGNNTYATALGQYDSLTVVNNGTSWDVI